MKTDKPVHLLIRFSNSLLKTGDTIDEHNKVVEQKGAVWFGKMGSTVSQKHIDVLNEQIEKGVPTYLYLVKGNRRKSTFYKAELIYASKSLPDEEKDLVPTYYQELDIPRFVKFWAKIGTITPADPADLRQLKVASSVFPISETLAKSSSGHFIICEAN